MVVLRIIGGAIAGCITSYVISRFFLGWIQTNISGTEPLLILAVVAFISGLVAGFIVSARIGGAIAGFFTQIFPPLFLTLEAYIRGSGSLEEYLGGYGSWLLNMFSNPGPLTTTPFIIAAVGGLLGGGLLGGSLITKRIDREETRELWERLRFTPKKSSNVLNIQVKENKAATKVCPNCGRTLQVDSKFCNDCGYRLGSLKTMQENVVKEVKYEVNCPNCGVKIPQNSKFCNSCGYKIVEISPPQEVVFNGYLEINGREYDSQLLSVGEKEQVIVSTDVEGNEQINFYIMSDPSFSRWRKNEVVSDTFISKNYISKDVTEWIPPRLGEYWLVFDNTSSQTNKRCKVQIVIRKIV